MNCCLDYFHEIMCDKLTIFYLIKRKIGAMNFIEFLCKSTDKSIDYLLRRYNLDYATCKHYLCSLWDDPKSWQTQNSETNTNETWIEEITQGWLSEVCGSECTQQLCKLSDLKYPCTTVRLNQIKYQSTTPQTQGLEYW